jgi:hypothetical protein
MKHKLPRLFLAACLSMAFLAPYNIHAQQKVTDKQAKKNLYKNTLSKMKKHPFLSAGVDGVFGFSSFSGVSRYGEPKAIANSYGIYGNVGLNFTRKLSLHIGLGYYVAGGSTYQWVESTGGIYSYFYAAETAYELQYTSIPVLFRWKGVGKKHVFVQTGPQFDFLNIANNYDGYYRVTPEFNTKNVSWYIGVGVKFGYHLSFEMSKSFGLSNIASPTNSEPYIYLQNFGIVKLGWEFLSTERDVKKKYKERMNNINIDDI